MLQAPRSVALRRLLPVLRQGAVPGCVGHLCIAPCGPRTAQCRPQSCPAYPLARVFARAIQLSLIPARRGAPGSS
eukprot:11190765-Lingulodinium_polyedra.AAC.1